MRAELEGGFGTSHEWCATLYWSDTAYGGAGWCYTVSCDGRYSNSGYLSPAACDADTEDELIAVLVREAPHLAGIPVHIETRTAISARLAVS